MKCSIKNFLSKCDQILRKLQGWSHLLKKILMENFIFCAVLDSLDINPSSEARARFCNVTIKVYLSMTYIVNEKTFLSFFQYTLYFSPSA